MNKDQNEPREIWRPVKGFEDRYEVSNQGRIKSFIFRKTRKSITYYEKPKILSPGINPGGYLHVKLHNGKEFKQELISRLVAKTFIGDIPKGMEVAHLNGIRNDNRLCNLSITTRKENHSHKKLHGTHQLGEKTNSVKLTSKQVLKIIELRNSGMTLLRIAKKFSVTEANISAICIGKSWAHLTGIQYSRKALAGGQDGKDGGQ